MGFPRRLLGKGSNHGTLLTQSTPTTQDQLLRAQRHKDGRIRYQCCQCSSRLMLTYLHTVQRPSQTLFQGSNPCRGHLFPTLGVRTSHWNLKDLVHSQNNSAFSSHLRLAPTKCRQLQCGQSSGNRWFSAKMRTKASESSTKANAWCAASIRRRVAWSGLTWLTSQSHSALQRHAYLKTFREYVNNFVYTYKYMQYIYICITIIYTVYMFFKLHNRCYDNCYVEAASLNLIHPDPLSISRPAFTIFPKDWPSSHCISRRFGPSTLKRILFWLGTSLPVYQSPDFSSLSCEQQVAGVPKSTGTL